jgi:hypothetical protein
LIGTTAYSAQEIGIHVPLYSTVHMKAIYKVRDLAKSTSGAHCLRRKTSVFLASKCYVGVNVGNVKKTVYKIDFSFGLCGQRFRSRSFLKFCSGHLEFVPVI